MASIVMQRKLNCVAWCGCPVASGTVSSSTRTVLKTRITLGLTHVYLTCCTTILLSVALLRAQLQGHMHTYKSLSAALFIIQIRPNFKNPAHSISFPIAHTAHHDVPVDEGVTDNCALEVFFSSSSSVIIRTRNVSRYFRCQTRRGYAAMSCPHANRLVGGPI